ncbi:MAG: hypothetical protein WBW84_13930 [Acidobacteriaceae bacterium]
MKSERQAISPTLRARSVVIFARHRPFRRVTVAMGLAMAFAWEIAVQRLPVCDLKCMTVIIGPPMA